MGERHGGMSEKKFNKEGPSINTKMGLLISEYSLK